MSDSLRLGALLGFELAGALLVLSVLYYAWKPWREVRGVVACVCMGVAWALFFAATIVWLSDVESTEVKLLTWINVPPLLVVSWVVDLSAPALILSLFTLLISFLVQLYSVAYLEPQQRRARYFMWMGAFTINMLGVFVAADIWSLFFCWAWIGICSYMLIGHKYREESVARAAAGAFLIAKLADIAFLVALVVLSLYLSKMDVGSLAMFFDRYNFLIEVNILALLFVGMVLGKSAQFPFQLWLLMAMRGPVPVSALLHSATLVVVGVFFLGRLSFIVTPEIGHWLLLLSLGTSMVAAFSAAIERQVKRLLAYSTISQLGLMMSLVALGQAQVAFVYLVVHGMAKALLFLSTGLISKQLREKNLSEEQSEMLPAMGALRHQMPLPYLSCVCACVVLLGLPLGAAYEVKAYLWDQLWSYGGGFALLLMLCLVGTGLYVGRLLGYLLAGKALRGEGHFFSRLWKGSWALQLPLWICSLGCWAVVYEYPRVGQVGWLVEGMRRLHVAGPALEAMEWNGSLLGWLQWIPVLVAVGMIAHLRGLWDWPRGIRRGLRSVHPYVHLQLGLRTYEGGRGGLLSTAHFFAHIESWILYALGKGWVNLHLLLGLCVYFVDRRVVSEGWQRIAQGLYRGGRGASALAWQSLSARMTWVWVFFLLFLLTIYGLCCR